MRDSYFSNWKFVLQEMCQYDKKYPFYIALKSAAAFLGPFLAAIIPSVAIALIQAEYNAVTFSMAMFLLVAGNFCMGFVSMLMDSLIQKKNFYVSYDAVQHHVVDQILTMDYSVLESAHGKRLADAAKYSYELDWQGWNRVMDMFTPFVYNLLGIIIYAILLAPKCPWVLPIFLLMSVMNLLLEKKISQKGYGKHRSVIRETDSKVNYFFQRSTSATDGKDIRMYRMEKWFGDIMDAMVKKRMMVWKRVELAYFWPCFSDTVWSLIRDIIAYSVLVGQFLDGSLDAATFTLYLGIITGFAGWLNGGNMGDGFVRAYSEMMRCNWSISDYREFMAQPNPYRNGKSNDSSGNLSISHKNAVPETDAPGQKMTFSAKPDGAEIEFRNVCFRYPEAEKDTIHNLNLQIHAGEKIALVGVNGAGKTTLVKLLCGFYQPSSGEILVNGMNIQDYDLEEYQKQVGAVFQDMMVMATSVAENIACCKKEQIDSNCLWNCMELADIADKVKELSQKEDTSVTNFLDKDGVLFSGGELQRILLARALYKDAPILLLDEPTSALDPLAELAVYEQYHKLSEHKTTVFISHRLASTRFCSRILFYDGGQIKEDGSHEELMALQGEYAEMFALQSQYYEENGEEDG